MLAIGAILAVAAWFLTESLVERDARHRFQATTTAIAAKAESNTRSYAELLYGLGGLFEAEPAVSRAGFNRYVHRLDLPLHYPGIRSISYAQHLRAPAKAKFEKELSSDPELSRRGYGNVVIKPAGERAEYFVIKYIEPLHANNAAVGFDVGSEKARIPVIDLARDSGMPALSRPIALVAEPTRSKIGVVLRLALYRKDALVSDVERRREAFIGLLNVTFLVDELAQRILAGEGNEQVTLSIHDAGPVGNNTPSTAVEIYSNAALGPSQAGAVLKNSRYIDVGQRRWELKFSAPQGPFMRDADRFLPWAAFSALLTVSLLLSGLIRSLANSRQRAKTLAEKMTADLSESHARLAEERRKTLELIEALPNPIYFKSTDGRYLGVNRAWESYFGKPRDAIIGKTVHDLYPDNPGLANKLQADDQAVWDNPGARSYETTITTQDGRAHEAVFYKATFTHADGRVAGLIGTIVDISERKQAEAARARLAAIVEHSNDAIFSRALDGTILSWNDGAERMLGFTAAETIGKPIAMTLPPDRPPNLAKNNETLLRGEVVARESNRMTKDGRVIDVLTSHSPIMDNTRNIIGASIILQDITALKQAQAEAQASEERFRATFDQAAVGIVHTTFDGNYLQVNQKFCEMLGYREHELVGHAAADFTHPDDRESGRQHRQHMWEGKLAGFTEEKRYLRKDGGVIWTNRTVSVAHDASGKPLYFIRVIEDITARKEIEERYRATFDEAPVGIMHTAIDGYRILRANRKLCEMLGYTQDELLGMSSTEVVHPDYRFSDSNSYRQPILDGVRQSFASERKFIRKDGSSFWVERTVSVVRNAAGEPLYFIRIAADIDERKQAEAARSQLAAIVESSNDAIVGRDLGREIVSWNAAAERLFGYTASEAIGMSISLLIPPGHEQAAARNRALLAQGQGVYDFETERVAKSGQIIPVSLSQSPIRDAHGAMVGASIIFRDIRERKQAEAATKAAEDRFRAMFDSAAVGITCINLDGMLVDVNQKFCEILGYARDELIGRAIRHITHPEDYGKGVALRSQVTLGETQQAVGEKRFLRKDGAVIWARRTLSMARDSAGAPQYAISVVEDITESKYAQMRQEMEHAVTRLLSEADRSSGVVSKVIGVIGEAFDCACGAYWREDKHKQLLVCTDIWSEPSAEIMAFAGSNREFKHPIHLAGKLSMRAWNSGEPVWIDDLTREAELQRAPLALMAGLHGAFAFPIRSGKETVGVMEFFSRASRPPDEALLQSTRALGNQIGLFMARKEAEERLRHLAHYDELTGLANRSMFGERLNHALAQAQRHHKLLTVLFVDLDRFKHINDTLGHEAGDRVLREVSQRLLGCVRASDTVGRLGGDEFVVLLEELVQPLHVGAIAQKILDAVAKPYHLDTQECHLSASVGISSYPADGETMQNLLKNADIAMYRAKEQGKNNFQYYSAQMNAHSLERMETESDLRHALERNELLLHYQPKINDASGHITGMEALLRWQHPTKGLIPPARFIPLAEENGLIVPIGAWVLRTACTQNKTWQKQGLPPLRIAVNLSARQFFHENLLQDVSDILDETGLEPAMLEFEITESMMMHDPAHAVKLLTEIKALGVHLSIDDFGTGYSSLSYLKSFPIDSLKIDRSFIHGLPDDKNDVAITGAIIAMARSLNLNVIAEGVETVGQIRFLRQHGCNDMQGYYFSKPVPAREFAQLMLDHATSATPQ